MKRRDLAETVDEIVDPRNPAVVKPATINTVQRVIGLLANFAQLSALCRSLLLVPRAEMNDFQAHLHHEISTKGASADHQTKCCVFSLHSRKNIIFVRAILLESITHHLPMEYPRGRGVYQGGADLVLFTDASGRPQEFSDPNWRPTCLGVFSPASIYSPTTELTCFLLPYSFLTGTDRRGPLYHDTTLVSDLSNLSVISIHFFSWNFSLPLLSSSGAQLNIGRSQSPSTLTTRPRSPSGPTRAARGSIWPSSWSPSSTSRPPSTLDCP